MSGPLDEAIATAVRLLADQTGIAFDVDTLAALAQRGATLLADLVDGHAKKHAAAAGEAAASKITTLEEAEQSAKKR